MSDRPSTDQILRVKVIGDDKILHPWVEITMEIHIEQDMAEALTVQFFPMGQPHDTEPNARVVQRDRVTTDEKEKFKLFASVVGRLTYHES